MLDAMAIGRLRAYFGINDPMARLLDTAAALTWDVSLDTLSAQSPRGAGACWKKPCSVDDAKYVNRHLAHLVHQPEVPDQQLPNGRVSILGYDAPALSKQVKRTPRLDQLAHDSGRVELGILRDVAGNFGEVIGR